MVNAVVEEAWREGKGEARGRRGVNAEDARKAVAEEVTDGEEGAS